MPCHRLHEIEYAYANRNALGQSVSHQSANSRNAMYHDANAQMMQIASFTMIPYHETSKPKSLALIVLLCSNHALGQEGPDGSNNGEDEGNGHDGPHGNTLLGRDLMRVKLQVEC